MRIRLGSGPKLCEEIRAEHAQHAELECQKAARSGVMHDARRKTNSRLQRTVRDQTIPFVELYARWRQICG